MLILSSVAAQAAVVYSNDFETNTNGFNSNSRQTLPSDAIGGQSTYLGSRSPPTTSVVLTLTGLTVGAVYTVAFDLYIGGTWDGSLSFGPDVFSLTSSSGGTLVSATFRNGFPIGNPTPGQTYSDATPLGNGGLFRTREGADAEVGEPIYRFSRDPGNPLILFTATSATEILTFRSVDAQGGAGDEFFSLDNVVVSTPDPAPTITNGPPTNGTVGAAYNFAYTSTGSPAFSVTTGALPPGLSLSAAGVISGIPTTAGTFNGAVTATNGTAPNATQVFNITIGLGNQTISFGVAPTLVVGSSGTLTATGGASGNPVTFTSTTPSVCSVSGANGSTVSGVAAGACTIAANQAGNSAFTAAPQVTQSFTVAAATRLINLSTRGQVQTGDNVMIGGFIIGGSSSKTVLIRAVGPNLANFGVPGVLANPTMQLFSGQTVIASNDDWQSNTNAAAIQATGLAPANSLESALLVTLAPGAYTAIVSGVGGGTGVGIIEVFEMDNPTIPLINISTRGQVQTGDNVMIGGFIIQGSASQTVLIRAVGPNLANFGVPGVLANPMLQLFSGQTVIASNDDWQSNANAAAIQATGLAPANSLESAILITLAPGAYTAIVSGVGGATGVGIVEVFAQ